MVEILGSAKFNAIVIFSLTFWWKYLCETVIYDILWMFLSSKCSCNSFNQVPLILVTILTIPFVNDSSILLLVCGGCTICVS